MFDLKKTRLYLLVGIVLVVFLLWSKWEAQFVPIPPAQIKEQNANKTQTLSTSHLLPTAGSLTSDSKAKPTSTATSAKFINIKSDVLDLHVDLSNGNLVGAKLLKYPVSIKDHQPIKFLFRSNEGQFIAQTGLVSSDLPNGELAFKANKSSYTFSPNQKTMNVNLTWSNGKVTVVKTYSVTQGSYDIGVAYTVDNKSGKAWTGKLFGQVVRTPPVKKKGLYTQIATYTGGVISTPSDHYQKAKFSDLKEAKMNITGHGGWAAMVEHYFITAWIPSQQIKNNFFGQDYGNNNYGVGSFSPSVTIQNGQTQTIGGHFYIGPTLTHQLAASAPYLTKTIDYGWLWFISKYLFIVLQWIHGVLGNWGWSIIVITLLIKLVFFPLSHKSYKSMAKVKAVQPKLKVLQDKHKGDKPALQKATMQLYQKEKVNPIGGCLPMLIQIPIFISLYWMLMASVELRQAPWIFWIKDLSVHDPYYVLPVLTGLMMLTQQLLSPKPPDKMQMYMFMAMPVLFTFFMFRLPAGLGLYMVVNIGVSILQQRGVMYWLSRKPSKKPKKS